MCVCVTQHEKNGGSDIQGQQGIVPIPKHRRHAIRRVTRVIRSVTEIFPIEEVSAHVYTPRWQPQDIRPMFCKCFTAQYP